MSESGETTKRIIKCSGPDLKSQHPMVYLIMSDDQVRCPYCSTEYTAPSKEQVRSS